MPATCQALNQLSVSNIWNLCHHELKYRSICKMASFLIIFYQLLYGQWIAFIKRCLVEFKQVNVQLPARLFWARTATHWRPAPMARLQVESLHPWGDITTGHVIPCSGFGPEWTGLPWGRQRRGQVLSLECLNSAKKKTPHAKSNLRRL